MPLISGALLGVLGCYFYRTALLNEIDSEVLTEVTIEYGHPITLDCFFTTIPPNTKFITNVDAIDYVVISNSVLFDTTTFSAEDDHVVELSETIGNIIKR